MIRGIRFVAAKVHVQKQGATDVISFSQASSYGNGLFLLHLIGTVMDRPLQWLWEGFEAQPWTGDTLPDGLYEGEELEHFLHQNAHQSLETGWFLGLPKELTPTAKPQTYTDFLASPFEIALIFYDAYYFDVYVKDPALAGKMLLALETIDADLSELEYITDLNDRRYGLRPF